MWAGYALLLSQSGSLISSGEDTYRLSDAIYLAPFGTLAEFSRSGEALAFVVPAEGENLPRVRQRAASNSQEPRTQSVIRFSALTGRRELVSTFPAGRRISNLKFVGPRSDLLFTVEGAELTEVFLAPERGSARLVSRLESRLEVGLATSRMRTEAVLLAYPQNQPVQIQVLSANGSRRVDAANSFDFAQVYGATAEGTFVFALGRRDPLRSQLYELNPRTTNLIPIDAVPSSLNEEVAEKPLFEVTTVTQPALPNIKESFNQVLLARPKKPAEGPALVIFRSTLPSYVVGPQATRFASNTETGFFYRELVKITK